VVASDSADVGFCWGSSQACRVRFATAALLIAAIPSCRGQRVSTACRPGASTAAKTCVVPRAARYRSSKDSGRPKPKACA